MDLYSVFFGEIYDALLRGREAVVVDPFDKQKATTHIVPEKFRDDIAALSAYLGEERLKNGLSIEVTLAELLDVVPRKRRRMLLSSDFVRLGMFVMNGKAFAYDNH